MDHEACFRVLHPHADQLFRAVEPEMAAETHPRSRAECCLDGTDTLILTVRAKDTAALRASLNMWLRLINVASEMQELIASEEMKV